jgi:hypothetical protein
VEDRDKPMVVETILKHARTGGVGDGKIFVSTIDEAYRVRTGEEGEEILQAHPPSEIPASARSIRRSCRVIHPYGG